MKHQRSVAVNPNKYHGRRLYALGLKMSEIPSGRPNKPNLLPWALLALFLGVGLYLRWVQTSSRSLWFDELFTLEISDRATLADVYAKGVVPDVHPPAYAFLMWGVIQLFGTGVGVIRGVSIAAGLTSTLAIYFATRKWIGVRGALIASALLAFCAAPLDFSSEARQGAITPMLGIFLFWAWSEWTFAITEGRAPSWKTVLGFTVTAILLIYTVYVGLILAFAAIVTLACFNYKQGVGGRQTLLAAVVVFGSFLPWIPVFLKHLDTPFWLTALPRPLHEGLLFVNFILSTDTGCIALIVSLLVIGLLPAQFFGSPATRNIRTFIVLCTVWLVAPFAVLLIKSLVMKPTFVFHGLLLSLGGGYGLVALGLAKSMETSRRKWIVLGLTSLLFVASYYPVGPPEQWQESMAYLASQVGNEPIVAYSCPQKLFHKDTDAQRYFFDYYLKIAGSKRRVSLIAGESQDWGSMVALFGSRPGTVFWYVSAHEDPDRAFLRDLNRSAQILDHKLFTHVGVWKFRWLGPH